MAAPREDATAVDLLAYVLSTPLLYRDTSDDPMPEPVAYLNDRFLPQSEARLALNDAGFVMGATVTDLFRTMRFRPFRLADHRHRFRTSCAAARIPQSRSDAELAAIAEELIARNAPLVPADADFAVVLFATPGPIGYYLGESGGPGDAAATFGMHSFPLPFSRYRSLFTEGARLVIPPTRQVPAASVDPRIKQRSRLHWWLAQQQVHDVDPKASALPLNEDGYVTETAAANLLVVRRGAVLTPPRATVLAGISLRVTEELCRHRGIPFAEQPLTPADCRDADEVLVTSTPFCLAGVSSIDGVSLPWPGPVFEALLASWNELVGFDLRRQILSNL
jgi:branched-subunit amino acid aminotransferase/4-amino-4-deoxychorismate lyase